MTDIYLNPATGDLFVSESGQIRLTSGTLETVAQRLKIKLRTFLGEWFLDANVGVPYFQSILGQRNPDLDPIRAIFRRVLLADPDVDSVPRLDVTLRADRTLEVIIDVYAIDRDVVTDTGNPAVVLIPVSTESDPLIWFW